jgi:hypothetical protein
MKVVSETLEHSKSSFTSDVYTSVIPRSCPGRGCRRHRPKDRWHRGHRAGPLQAGPPQAGFLTPTDIRVLPWPE